MAREVCVTGGTGFIASHVIKLLLERGYRVRATVRDPGDEKKVGFLRRLPGAAERLRLVPADLLVEGSFDEAVSGVDGVFHVASPVVVYNWENPEKSYLEPCLNGTANVLGSCSRSRPPIGRIVLTSSCSAVRYGSSFAHNNAANRSDGDKEPPLLDESNWSDVDYCKQHQLWYAWAKTIAERDAWRIAAETGLDLVVVNPAFVVGPSLSEVPTSTLAIVLGILRGDLKTYPNSRMGYVHVDDAARAHVLAFEHPAAAGRLICSGGVYHWREIVPMLTAKFPEYPITTTCGHEAGNDAPHRMDTRKLESLGFGAFASLETMFDDCVESLKLHGLLP